jgi:hypothetical protein
MYYRKYFVYTVRLKFRHLIDTQYNVHDLTNDTGDYKFQVRYTACIKGADYK